MIGNPDSGSRRRWRVAHAAWAVLAVALSLFLAFTKGGHPPLIFLLPPVLVVWVVGHFAIWGVRWLAAKGRRLASGTAGEGRPWPVGLRLALLGTGVGTSIGVFQLLMTALQGELYPFHYASLWAVMLAVWLVHGACFAGLLLRRRWSRFMGAMLAFGWAMLLASQIAEHLPRGASSDTAGLLIAFGMMVVILLFGLHLAASREVKSFLTH